MPWLESNVKELRRSLVMKWLASDEDKTDICRQFGVSRPTGYKWVKRFLEHGEAGLEDATSAPHHQANQTTMEVEDEIVKVRMRWPTWGPKKIEAWLQKHKAEADWPAASTIGDILTRRGLTVQRKYRRHVPPRTQPFGSLEHPNDSWSMDFKGIFPTADGQKCNPLTVTDNVSRYLLRCTHLDRGNGQSVWSVLEEVFRENGLPRVIRSDNGPPFASTAIGGLSALSVKLLKAGVIPEFITPGELQENGRHERMHRTLKAETASPAAASLPLQQQRFAEFVKYYNFDRPHEALNQRTPAEVHQVSSRTWTGRLISPEYPDEYTVRMVRVHGDIKWKGHRVPLTPILHGEPVGLVEVDNDTWQMFYGPIYLGTAFPEFWRAAGEKRRRTFLNRYH